MRRFSLVIIAILFSSSAGAECFNNFATSYKDRFIVHDDGTLTDRLTGLMWMRCNLGHRWDQAKKTCSNDDGIKAYSWTEALTTAATIRAGGVPGDQDLQPFGDYTDWRLPNIKEISSIIMRQCSTLETFRIDPYYFVNPGGNYWSSTPGTKALKTKETDFIVENSAWIGNFKLGRAEQVAMSLPQSVRLVRNAINNLVGN